MNEEFPLQSQALEDDFSDILSKAARGRADSSELLAQKVGRDAATIDAWLTGRAQPESASVPQLAEALALKPAALATSLARAWHPQTGLPQHVRTYIQSSYPESNGYLLTADDESEIALVDPAGDADMLTEMVRKTALPLRYLLITHRHNDHADAAAHLAERFPNAQVFMHEIEASARADAPPRAQILQDGDRAAFGGLMITALVTPGHTDGSTCFHYEGYICVGDMLFAGSVGRNFGPTATYDEQLRNIATRILTLPGDTVVLPGHGPVTTVALERLHNPFFPGMG